jgi:hypothetical protein
MWGLRVRVHWVAAPSECAKFVLPVVSARS